ncbi:putative sugar transporter, partial [Exophiala viscosa]
SLRDGLRRCYSAVFWSAFLSLGVIMEGYDAILLNSLYGLPSFQQKFGVRQPDGTYNITAKWQSIVSNAVMLGQFFGLFIAGWASDKFGFRRTTMVTCVLTAAVIFMQFFSTDLKMLTGAEVLFGFPLSVFLTLTTVYAADVCPLVLRPYLTTWVNLCWTIGKVISAGVLRAFVNTESHWGYKVPFATQWIWPPLILVGTFFAPESPYWLVRQNRGEDARKSLRRLFHGFTEQEIQQYLAQIVVTNEHEIELQQGTSYLDCLKGTNLRRTEIACMTWIIQPFCGFAVVGYATYFFEQAGIDSNDAFSLSLGQQAIAFCGGIAMWFILPRVGRRTLMLWGLVISAITQIIVGGLGIPAPRSGVAWATGAVLMVYILSYSMTIGPLAYIIVAEMGSSRLRAKTTVLARNAYQVATVVNNVLTTYQINSAAWNWRGKAGFFWGGFNVLLFVYCYYRLPEIKARTFLELDLLFENHVPARHFKDCDID